MAAKIPEETINQVRKSTNIVDVVSQYVQLKKRGKNYFGFCPFHDERTPSFSVTEEKQIFHCFSCGRGGNVFSFLMEIEGINFLESVKKTAELSGAQVPLELEESRPVHPFQDKKDQLIRIHEEAAAFYHQVLMNTVTGEKALSYLKERGFTDALLKEYQIGFSPLDKTTTYQILRAKNFSEEWLRETGIFSQREEQKELLDRFSGRIIFPLRDERGKTSAFSGRILPSEEPQEKDFHEAKYLNSPETILFSKRSFLFNLDKSRPEMRKNSEVILFEGYMDVIAAWDAGIKNGVASMGTSLTDEQIRILNKTVDSVVLAYDGDRAGMEATKKAIDLLKIGNRFDLSVFPLVSGMDPDEFIQEKGKDAFLQAIKGQRETVFQFHARYLKQQMDLSSEKNQLQYLEEMLKQLIQVESVVERELYINELAREFGLEPETLKKQLQDFQKDYMKKRQQEREQGPFQKKHTVFTVSATKKFTQAETSERQLLYRLFHFEEAWLYLRDTAPDFYFQDEQHQTIFLLYAAFYEEMGEAGHIDRFLDRVRNPELVKIISDIEMLDLQSNISSQEIDDLVNIITSKANLEAMLQQKKREMKEASRQNKSEEAKQLLSEIITLSQKIKVAKG